MTLAQAQILHRLADLIWNLSSGQIEAGRLKPSDDAGRQWLLSRHFQDDLRFDSLDLIELVMEVEEEFDIEVDDEEAEACLTVRQAVELIDRKLS
jgi:acyl carrier protein